MSEARWLAGWRLLAVCGVAGVLLGLGVRSMFRGGAETPPARTEVEDKGEMREMEEMGGGGSMEGHTMPSDAEPAGLLLDLGNELCPIMGNSVNPKVFTEWRGLRIGHCCPPCSKDLLEDPERLLDAAGIEWRPAADLAARIQAARGEDRARLLALARESFAVVREPRED